MPATIAESVIASSSFAINLDSLANSSATMSVSTPIFPSTTPLDELVTIAVAVSTAVAGNDRTIYVWAYGVLDSSTSNFTDGISGNSTGFVRSDPPNMRLIGTVPITGGSSIGTNLQHLRAGPWSMAAAFGGVLPRIYGVAVQNYTGNSLAASSGTVWHSAVFGQAT